MYMHLEKKHTYLSVLLTPLLIILHDQMYTRYTYLEHIIPGDRSSTVKSYLCICL